MTATNRREHLDVLALRAIMANDTAAMKRLETISRHTLGDCCPECGSVDTMLGVGQSFACCDCSHQWEA